jgi:PLP dependent protein
VSADGSPPTELVQQIAERLDVVRARISAAGGTGVRVLAVTKTFTVREVTAAVAAGCDGIGENYAQELVAKLGDVRVAAPVHFIGQLQNNKIHSLVGLVDVFETVDRRSVVDELAKRAPGARVLVQIAPTDVADVKGGCPLVDAGALIELAGSRGLTVAGVMCVGPTQGGPEAARPFFRAVRRLADEFGLATVSMGMTDDLEVAVEEGSTQVRVGSALFGNRPPRQ